MAPNAKRHRTVVDEASRSEAGMPMFRWACSCSRVGHWTTDKFAAEKGGRAHKRRMTPRRDFAALREVLRLDIR